MLLINLVNLNVLCLSSLRYPWVSPASHVHLLLAIQTSRILWPLVRVPSSPRVITSFGGLVRDILVICISEVSFPQLMFPEASTPRKVTIYCGNAGIILERFWATERWGCGWRKSPTGALKGWKWEWGKCSSAATRRYYQQGRFGMGTWC